MTAMPLRLGPLGGEGLPVRRSGLRWLCEDGHLCRPNEIVAFCNIGLGGANRAFAEEVADLQVALAPRVAGHVRRAPDVSPGGLLDRIPSLPWSPQTVWAHLDPVSGAEGPEEPDLLFVAGRRFTGVAEDRAGFLTGWHDRRRAWWGDGDEGTLLVPGTCQQDGLIRGDDGSFGGLFDVLRGPAQVVMTQGEPLAPCAAILNQQNARTREQADAIREDAMRSLLETGPAPSVAGWLFVGALLKGLEPAPLDERYDLLTRSGLRRSSPASALCLSLVGEGQQLLRHRRLGYVLNIYAYRLQGAGQAVRDWLRRDFEPCFQTIDDIAGQYRKLIEAAPGRAFILINRISSHLNEAIQSYEGLDDATMAQLASLRAQDLNLMLHDLAAAPNVELVDADAIAADLGIAKHLPDAAHATGELQQEIRAELLSRLRAQEVTGFAPRDLSRC